MYLLCPAKTQISLRIRVRVFLDTGSPAMYYSEVQINISINGIVPNSRWILCHSYKEINQHFHFVNETIIIVSRNVKKIPSNMCRLESPLSI